MGKAEIAEGWKLGTNDLLGFQARYCRPRGRAELFRQYEGQYKIQTALNMEPANAYGLVLGALADLCQERGGGRKGAFIQRAKREAEQFAPPGFKRDLKNFKSLTEGKYTRGRTTRGPDEADSNWRTACWDGMSGLLNEVTEPHDKVIVQEILSCIYVKRGHQSPFLYLHRLCHESAFLAREAVGEITWLTNQLKITPGTKGELVVVSGGPPIIAPRDDHQLKTLYDATLRAIQAGVDYYMVFPWHSTGLVAEHQSNAWQSTQRFCQEFLDADQPGRESVHPTPVDPSRVKGNEWAGAYLNPAFRFAWYRCWDEKDQKEEKFLYVSRPLSFSSDADPDYPFSIPTNPAEVELFERWLSTFVRPRARSLRNVKDVNTNCGFSLHEGTDLMRDKPRRIAQR